MVISFFVPGLPIAQPRPRGRGRLVDGKPMAQMYNPTSIKKKDGTRKKHPIVAYRQAVALKAKEAYSGPLLKGPLRVEAVFLFPRPGRLVWKKRPMPRKWHIGRPDCDNGVKAVLDAAKVIWGDDAQVCHLEVSKYFASGTEAIGTYVTVSELAEPVFDPACLSLDMFQSALAKGFHDDLAKQKPTG